MVLGLTWQGGKSKAWMMAWGLLLDFHVRPVRKRNVGARCAELIKLIYDEATMLRA